MVTGGSPAVGVLSIGVINLDELFSARAEVVRQRALQCLNP